MRSPRGRGCAPDDRFRTSGATPHITDGAAVASSGLLVGIGASPAWAAPADDCDVANTVTAPGEGAAEIQALLDADTATVCLSGTFTLTAPLTFDHDLVIFGLDSAVLDGDGVTNILEGTSGARLSAGYLSFVNGVGTSGGAITVDGDLAVGSSSFTGNLATAGGGAIFADGDGSLEVEIFDSTFTNNSTGLSGAPGGAVFADGESTVYIFDSTFDGNQAGEFGGAVAGYVVLAEPSTFIDNEAEFGGALYGFATLTVESTFAENAAVQGGANASVYYAAVVDSTFVGNTAEEIGGALVAADFAVIQNSTFVDNDGGEVGGALATAGGSITFTTFLGNEADEADAVMIFEEGFGSGEFDDLELGGNIFAGTSGNSQLRLDSPGDDSASFTDLGGNVFSTSRAAESDLEPAHESSLFSRSVEDIFGPNPAPTDNGGATETVALVAGSPAIDAVPDIDVEWIFTADEVFLEDFAASSDSFAAVDDYFAVADDEETFDQRGVKRTALADAGSFEYGVAELASTGPENASQATWFAAVLVALGSLVLLVSRRSRRLS